MTGKERDTFFDKLSQDPAKWHVVLDRLKGEGAQRACVVIFAPDFLGATQEAYAIAMAPEYADTHAIAAIAAGDILERQAALHSLLGVTAQYVTSERLLRRIVEVRA
jgi:dihydroxyacid dehydratase/phosphogluconate dehydratase